LYGLSACRLARLHREKFISPAVFLPAHNGAAHIGAVGIIFIKIITLKTHHLLWERLKLFAGGDKSMADARCPCTSLQSVSILQGAIKGCLIFQQNLPFLDISHEYMELEFWMKMLVLYLPQWLPILLQTSS